MPARFVEVRDMLRRILVVLQTVALLVGAVTVSRAAVGSGAVPPAGSISSNVEFVANLPEAASAISINFIGKDMFVSTVKGLLSYDISDPAAPKLIGSLPYYIWENEDVDVDTARHLLFVSRDPRGFTSPATTVFPYGAVEVYDVSNPSVFRLVSVTTLPTGHTTTCIDKCMYTWTGGPATSQLDPHNWGFGRPIYALDMHDPAHPVPCPKPIDTGRSDGQTSYAHDVQVDAMGIAWVSGDGGVRGYWTTGRHRDPVDGKVKTATGCNPVPYAGGGTLLGRYKTRDGLMHNSWRDLNASVDGHKGDVLYSTEEVTGAPTCKAFGRFATYDLRGTFDGEGWRDIAKTHFRMHELDEWTPEKQAGSNGCDSAHYFTDNGSQLLAGAYYTQGTRFLDVSDPRNIRQVGYFRPNDANTWAAYWHDGYVYIADLTRGIDVIKFNGNTSAPASLPTLTAPPLVASRALAKVDKPQPFWHWMCVQPR